MLEVSVPIAHELLAQCVRQGEALVQRASLVGDSSDYESWRAARNQWISSTTQALEHMYGGDSQSAELTQTVTAPGGGQSWQQQYAADLQAVKDAVQLLGVLQSDLAFAREDGDAASVSSGPALHSPAPELTAAPEVTATPELAPSRAPEPSPNIPEQAASSFAGPQPEPQTARAERPAQAPPSLRPEEDDSAPSKPPADVAAEAHRQADSDASERIDEEPAIGAELEHAPFVVAELEHANGSVSAERAGSAGPVPRTGKQVLLAHGRNERWMRAVVALLEQAGTHEVTILNERPAGRGALSEQFGEHSSGSRYAVVLLTADDIAAPRVESENEPYFSPRAHQAVVFEMGFLVAALAPGGVCVLYEEGVQLPCDLEGIAYVRLDLAGTWQPKLLLQLRKAGFDYDLNKLVAA